MRGSIGTRTHRFTASVGLLLILLLRDRRRSLLALAQRLLPGLPRRFPLELPLSLLPELLQRLLLELPQTLPETDQPPA